MRRKPFAPKQPFSQKGNPKKLTPQGAVHFLLPDLFNSFAKKTAGHIVLGILAFNASQNLLN